MSKIRIDTTSTSGQNAADDCLPCSLCLAAMKPPAVKLVRVQLDLPAARITDIEAIMAKTGVRTRKDVFENALALLEWAVQERMDGRIIVSFNKTENKIRQLVMPALAAVKSRL